MVEEIAASTPPVSQAYLCRQVGITSKHLNQFLNGHCGMSLDIVDSIFRVLGRDLILSTRANLGYRVTNKTSNEKGNTTNDALHIVNSVA